MFGDVNKKTIRKCCFVIAFCLSGTGLLFSQGDQCSSIQPFCAGTTQFVFENSNYTNSNTTDAELGPAYGCLDAQPYPAWFFLQIENPGTLEFQISQTVNPDGTGGTLDVDFIAWGPFSEDGDFCSDSALSSRNIIDCSYLPDSVENFAIDNAVAGDIYVVLITNYSTEPGYISLEQVNTSGANAGTTDCSIVNILGEDQAVCDDEPVELVARNVIATDYEWYVFDETSEEFKAIPGESDDIFTVSETGLYQVITTNEITGTEMSDQVHIEYFDLPEAKIPADMAVCSNENITSFDLTETEEELTENYVGSGEGFTLNFYDSEENFENDIKIEEPSDFQGIDQQEIIATITSEVSGCASEPVRFSLLIYPEIDTDIAEELVICLDSSGNFVESVSVGQDLGSGYSYQWDPPNDPDGDGEDNAIFEITDIPDYDVLSVSITQEETGCITRYDIDVKMFAPPAGVEIEISGSDFDDGYMVAATATGGMEDGAEYEYQLNNGSWQSEPVFAPVPAGRHTITAREINGCGSATSEEFRLIGYPRFFTPNSDGYNDTWKMINDGDFSIGKILIFDRYGKLLKQIYGNSSGWDGTFNGQPMPADDYWFLLEYNEVDTGEIREFKGHFSLKR